MKIFRINLEVTNACNLDCPGCRRPREGNKVMSFETFQKIINRLHLYNRCRKLFLFWRGEPTLVFDLPEMVSYARERGFWVGTSTNLTTKNMHNFSYVDRLLNNVNRIVMNVDGYNQETLEKYRVNADWDTVIRNLETISKCNVGVCELHVLMFKWNDGKENFYRNLAKKYGISKILFKTPIINSKPILSNDEADEWMSQKYRRYKNRGNRWIHLSKRRCNVRGFCISVDGNIFPCPLNNGEDKMEYCLGNILDNGSDTINLNISKFPRGKMRSRQLSICGDCTCLPNVKVAFREKLNVIVKGLGE